MWQVTNDFRVKIGSNTYINLRSVIDYKGTALFTIKRHDDGYLGIDFDIYDANGLKVATVRRNEIYEGNKADYEIDGSADRYVLTEKATGRVICDLRKRTAAAPVEIDVAVDLFTPSGFHLEATADGTNAPNGNGISNCEFEGNGTGTAISLN